MQKTEEMFHKWNADRRPDTFESRLLATRLKARFRCPLHLAYQAMSDLGADDTFEKLICELKTKTAGSSKKIESMSAIARRSRITATVDCAPADEKNPRIWLLGCRLHTNRQKLIPRLAFDNPH